MTYLEEEIEPISFTNNILGSYSTKYFFKNFPTQTSPYPVHYFSSQIKNYSQTNTSQCVNIVELFVNDPVNNPLDNLFGLFILMDQIPMMV